MDAVGLIFLILFLIAFGMSIYYATLCLQAYPLDSILYAHPDMGPLLSDEHDMNGNHESDVPPIESVCLKLKETDLNEEKMKTCDDVEGACKPLIDNSYNTHLQPTPECASIQPLTKETHINGADDPSCFNDITATNIAKLLGHAPLTVDSKEYVSVPIDTTEAPENVFSVSYEEDGLMVPRNTAVTNPQIHTTNNRSVTSSIPHQTDPSSGATPKCISINSAPFVISPIVDTSNLPYCKTMQAKRKPSVPVFHFSTPNSGSPHDNEPLSAFCCKHKGDECVGSPCKKTKQCAPLEKSMSLPAEASIDNLSAVKESLPPGNTDEPKKDHTTKDSELTQEPSHTQNHYINLQTDIPQIELIKPSTENESCPGTDIRKNSPVGWNVIDGETNELGTFLVKDSAQNISSSSILGSNCSLKGNETETSEPDVTEYSFTSGPKLSSTAEILANEVGSNSNGDVDLTQYVPLVESNDHSSNKDATTTEKPSNTKGVNSNKDVDKIKFSPIVESNNQGTTEDVETNRNDNHLPTETKEHDFNNQVDLISTPPNTPPDMKMSSNSLVIKNPCAEIIENEGNFIKKEDSILPPYGLDLHPRERCGSTCSSSTSESSSNGSYTFEHDKAELNGSVDAHHVATNLAKPAMVTKAEK